MSTILRLFDSCGILVYIHYIEQLLVYPKTALQLYSSIYATEKKNCSIIIYKQTFVYVVWVYDHMTYLTNP